MIPDDNIPASTGFGSSVSIISEGHAVVGTSDTSNPQLYNFRRRGPQWTPVPSNDLLVPAAPATAKLGRSAAIDGSLAVLGAPDFDNRGAVFVFANTPGTNQWTQQALIQGDDLGAGDDFGATVSISGNTLLVGAPGTSGGAAYAFERIGGDWTQQQKLTGAGNNFGQAVDLYGDTAVVGSQNTVSVFARGNSTWTLQQPLTNNAASGFGSAVAVHENTLAVGAPESGAGQAFVYTRNGAAWTLQGGALAPTGPGTSGAKFGSSVDVQDDRLVVGAPLYDVNNGSVATDAGAVFSYTRSGAVWTSAGRTDLAASAAAGDAFGHDVAIDGERLVVGAFNRASNGNLAAGEAFAYGWKNNAWALETVSAPLASSTPNAGDQLGYAVAISGDLAILGAPQLNGRPSLPDTYGEGYAFVRDVSPPVVVTYPEQQSVLIAGAQANTISGSLGATQTAALSFFDIPDVTLQTGAGADAIALNDPGLQAHGLLKFELKTGAGQDALTIKTDGLDPPAVDAFEQTGDFGGSNSGAPLPQGAGYRRLSGGFTFDGGADADTINAQADTDWTLGASSLAAGNGESVSLANVENANLKGGAGTNFLRVNAWTGSVTLDGLEGADQFEFGTSLNSATVNDTGTSGVDRLTITGGAESEQFVIDNNGVTVGMKTYSLTGVESLSLAAGDGADQFSLFSSTASSLFLDGQGGSDIYDVFMDVFTTPLEVRVRDSGPPSDGANNVDRLNIPADSTVFADRATLNASTTYFDNTIEELAFSLPQPILNITGTAAGNRYVINDKTLTIDGGRPINIASVQELTIDGAGGADEFVVLGYPASLNKLDLIGGADSDKIFGLDTASVYTINGVNQGNVTGAFPFTFTFSSVESLAGGAAADTFKLANASAALSGGVSGGGGVDVLDYSARSSAVSVDLGLGTATAAGVIDGLETFVGGTGTNTLTGPNTSNTWNITGTDRGSINSVLSFTSFAKLVGGSSDDIFQVGGQSISGSIDGAAGRNELTLSGTSAADNVTIGAASVTRTGLGVTNYANIDILSLDTLGGSDVIGLSIAAGGSPSTVNLVAGADDDAITLNIADGATSRINVDAGASTSGDSVTINGSSAADRITLDGADVRVGAAVVALTAVEDLTVDAAGGTDTVNVLSTGVSGAVIIRGGADNDQVNIQTIATGTTVHGDGGADTVRVGGFAPSLGGTVDGVAASLTVNGDAGADVLLIDDSGDDSGDTASLNATQVAGLGSATPIIYSAIETLDVSTGSGADTVNVATTGAATTINTGDAADIVNVQAINHATSLNLEGGDDDVNVGSLAPASGGVLDGLAALLTIGGGDGNDDLRLDDTGFGAGRTGSVNATSVTGFGMASGVNHSEVELLDVSLGAGGDGVTIQDSLTGNTVINTGGGADSVLVVTASGEATINTGAGNDIVDVRAAKEGTLVLNGGADNDTFNVGSAAPALGGTLEAIESDITINGDAGTDVLNLDDSGEQLDSTGVLTGSTLTGLGVLTAVNYGTLETLNLELGAAADTLSIQGTHAGATNVNGGAGNDQIDVQAIAGATNIRGGADNDTVNVGSLAPLQGGIVDGVAATLQVHGEAGTDQLTVDDSGDTTGDTANITATSVSGLGSASGVNYQTFETLQVNSGSGADTIHIVDTGAATTVNANEAGDTVNVRAIRHATNIGLGEGDDDVNVGSLTPALGGTLDPIAALLTITGGAGNDDLNLDDTGDSSGRTGVIAAASVTGLGMASGVNQTEVENLTVGLGTGGDALTVQGVFAGANVLNTNGGMDTVNVRAAQAGSTTTINGGGENDTFHVGSLAPASGGVLDGVDTDLRINGDGGLDVLNVDDSGDQTDNIGALSGSSLTGLGMASGLTYGTVETLNLDLGAKADTLSVSNTHGGATVIRGNAGADKIHLQAIAGQTTVNGGADNDTVVVGSNAPSLAGVVDNIAAALTINGDAGDDTVTIDDSGDTSGDTASLTPTLVTGLGSASGVVYGTVETLHINLGSGGDTFTINNTHAGATTLNANGGADTVHVRSTSGVTTVNGGAQGDTINVQSIDAMTTINAGANDDVVNVGSLAPLSGGELDQIRASLIVNGDPEFDKLNLDDSGDADSRVRRHRPDDHHRLWHVRRHFLLHDRGTQPGPGRRGSRSNH